VKVDLRARTPLDVRYLEQKFVRTNVDDLAGARFIAPADSGKQHRFLVKCVCENRLDLGRILNRLPMEASKLAPIQRR
jgi:hypothetical protein